jgi:hypothetical protein
MTQTEKQKKARFKKLIKKTEFTKNPFNKTIQQAIAIQKIINHQYRQDPEFKKMIIKLRNAFYTQKIGTIELQQYFKKSLLESIDRTSLKWITIEELTEKKKTPKKKSKKKTTKKKKANKKKNRQKEGKEKRERKKKTKRKERKLKRKQKKTAN